MTDVTFTETNVIALDVETSTDQGPEVRECDCPPWVVRCAHFGDDGIAIADGDIILASITKGIHVRTGGKYSVTRLPFRLCDCGLAHYSQLDSFQTDDYDAALTAFYEAERELLATSCICGGTGAIPPVTCPDCNPEGLNHA